MQFSYTAQPLLCRELIGREHELAGLTNALSLAATGQPQFMLVSGEAGLGKTRLSRALAETSREQGALVLAGQAVLQEQVLPFGPFRYFVDGFGSSLDFVS